MRFMCVYVYIPRFGLPKAFQFWNRAIEDVRFSSEIDIVKSLDLKLLTDSLSESKQPSHSSFIVIRT